MPGYTYNMDIYLGQVRTGVTADKTATYTTVK
jgi:hypothetical protein